MKRKSLRVRLIEFFTDNQDEELTFDMIVQKYEVSRHAAVMAVWRLAQEGALESVHVIRRVEKGMK